MLLHTSSDHILSTSFTDTCPTCGLPFDFTKRQPLFLPCGDDLCTACLLSLLGRHPTKLSDQPQEQPVIQCPGCAVSFVVSRRFMEQLSRVVQCVHLKQYQKGYERLPKGYYPYVEVKWEYKYMCGNLREFMGIGQQCCVQWEPNSQEDSTKAMITSSEDEKGYQGDKESPKAAMKKREGKRLTKRKSLGGAKIGAQICNFDRLYEDYYKTLSLASSATQSAGNITSCDEDGLICVDLGNSSSSLAEEKIEKKGKSENSVVISIPLHDKKQSNKITIWQKPAPTEYQELLIQNDFDEPMVITDLDLAFDHKEESPSPFDKYSTTTFGLTQPIKTMLLSWLDPSAQLTLLFRGSEHGISPLSFHQHCDKKGATLTLVKSDLGKVFGGYTQVSWRSESRPKAVKDNKAFVFSLTHKQRYALKHFNGPAVVHSKDFMAVFGRETLRDIFLQRNDGRMANNNTSDFGANYILPKEMVIGSEQSTSHLSGTGLMFKIAEIEVYQVVIAK